MAKALFLDRDGTINVDTGYVYERAKFTFLDGVFDFCRRAQEKGYLIIVITNQSGIARGYYTEADYERLTAWMRGEFAAHGVTVTDVFHCPALEGPDRKPAPGLFLKARDRYAIDMAASVNIGDKPRDLEAGERAGVGTNILFTGNWRTMALPTADAANTPEQQAAERTFGVAFTAFDWLDGLESSAPHRSRTRRIPRGAGPLRRAQAERPPAEEAPGVSRAAGGDAARAALPAAAPGDPARAVVHGALNSRVGVQ